MHIQLKGGGIFTSLYVQNGMEQTTPTVATPYEFSLLTRDPEPNHPSSEDDPNHNGHSQVGLPDVHTSELERVDDCDDCSTSS